jgi:3-hydroxybutyryl-CoA dehydratase
MLHHAFERLSEGDRFTSRGRTVTEGDVHAFAAQTGDLHPQHTDADWASRSPFGERIAHGMLVLSYAVGLVGFDPERVLALRRISDAVFKRPVKLGDSIHVEGSVIGLNAINDEAGLVTIGLRILNQDGQTVCRAKVEALWRRDAPVPDAVMATDDGFVPIPL